MEGWIKIHRQLLDWEWYKDINVMRLWIHLLLKANYEDKYWKGQHIKRGQLITSIRTLSKETGLSNQQIRNTLNKLKSTHNIAHETTHNYTLITILKYIDFQDGQIKNNTLYNTQTNKETTHKPTTTKEIKNIYLYLYNIYKSKLEGKTFGQKIHIINQCRDTEEYMSLSVDEQYKLFMELSSIK